MRVLSYSGTGNSRFIANRIAEALGTRISDLNGMIKGKKKTVFDDEDLVLVTPTYCWRVPRIVTSFLLGCDLSAVKRIWFVMSCGDEAGNAPSYNRSFCEEVQAVYMGTAPIVMPENYIAMFEVPDKDEAISIIRKSEGRIGEVIEALLKREKIKDPDISLIDRIKSGPLNPVFYKVSVKADGYWVNDGCISCGICVKKCPLNNIRLEDGRPVWGKDCTHCMACICYCPKEAIEYKRISKGKFRYHIEALDLK